MTATVPYPSFENPGTWCWFITSLLFVLIAIRDIIPADGTVNTPFISSLMKLFPVKTNVKLKLTTLFKEFLDGYMPDLTREGRRAMTTNHQYGDTLFEAMQNNKVGFFKSMQLPIRRFIERRNCQLKCPDDDATADDKYRYDEPERTTPIDYKGVCRVPMPEVGQSLEESFVEDLQKVAVSQKVCNHMNTNGQKCQGTKWQRIRQEITGCPDAIVLQLNRGYFEKEADGVTLKRYYIGNGDQFTLKELIDRTPVKVDGHFEINAPPRALHVADAALSDVNKIRYELAAATQHFGN